MLEGKSLAVVVPAYDEEQLVATTIRGIPDFVDRIIVVDDASRDGTAAAARGSGDPRVDVVTHERNAGVGAAIVTGYRRAVAEGIDVVCVMAADNQMDPDDLEQIALPVVRGEVEYAKANRLVSGQAWEVIPRSRYLGNAMLSFLTKIASGYWHVADSQSGYTAASREILEQLDLERIYPRYGFPNDMLVHLNVWNARVRDVTARPVYNVGEKSGIKIRKVVPRISWLLRQGLLLADAREVRHPRLPPARLLLRARVPDDACSGSRSGSSRWCCASWGTRCRSARSCSSRCCSSSARSSRCLRCGSTWSRTRTCAEGPGMSCSVDVVITTHQGWELTQRCLEHLAQQTIEHRVIVSDGASHRRNTPTTSGRTSPTSRWSRTTTIQGMRPPTNEGVAAGIGDVILLLNNDAFCRPDFLEQLVASFDDERVGAVAPLTLRPDERTIDSVGLTLDATVAPFIRLSGQPARSGDSYWPTLVAPGGGADAYRRSAWTEAGGFDDRLSFYGADLDLGLRLRSLGWMTVAAPDAVAVHLRSATSGHRSRRARESGGWARDVLRRWAC